MRGVEQRWAGLFTDFTQRSEQKDENLPGRGPERRNEGLQEATDEAVGVLPCHKEVEQRQDEEAVDEETNDDRHRVHPQLASHLGQVLHLHDLPSDQEEDANGSVPVGGEQEHDVI